MTTQNKESTLELIHKAIKEHQDQPHGNSRPVFYGELELDDVDFVSLPQEHMFPYLNAALDNCVNELELKNTGGKWLEVRPKDSRQLFTDFLTCSYLLEYASMLEHRAAHFIDYILEVFNPVRFFTNIGHGNSMSPSPVLNLTISHKAYKELGYMEFTFAIITKNKIGVFCSFGKD
ncbi:MAG: hypothetical protein IT292_05625 [Deltaproteobacteria bacterium]|nr:hypothetical protein [Deltaproteobacteria bacterium]